MWVLRRSRLRWVSDRSARIPAKTRSWDLRDLPDAEQICPKWRRIDGSEQFFAGFGGLRAEKLLRAA
jgi:hypothetical protein